MWALWWVWMAGAVALGILEIFAPGFVFLGFAAGAALTGILLAAGLSPSLPWLLLIFAVVSLASWLALRRILGVRKGQVKIWDRDINED
ncbi:MAG: NfeD family protein [Paracoccaceae bacterium]